MLPWHSPKIKQGIPATANVPEPLVFSGFPDILFIPFVSIKRFTFPRICWISASPGVSLQNPCRSASEQKENLSGHARRLFATDVHRCMSDNILSVVPPAPLPVSFSYLLWALGFPPFLFLSRKAVSASFGSILLTVCNSAVSRSNSSSNQNSIETIFPE